MTEKAFFKFASKRWWKVNNEDFDQHLECAAPMLVNIYYKQGIKNMFLHVASTANLPLPNIANPIIILYPFY